VPGEWLAAREKRRSQWTTAADNLDHSDEQWIGMLPATALLMRTDRRVPELLPIVLGYVCGEADWSSP
jgi:hypothetical protein